MLSEWTRASLRLLLGPVPIPDPGVGQEDPRRRKWQLTPVFLHEKYHGQRCLAGTIKSIKSQSRTPLSMHAHLDFNLGTISAELWMDYFILWSLSRGNFDIDVRFKTWSKKKKLPQGP